MRKNKTYMSNRTVAVITSSAVVALAVTVAVACANSAINSDKTPSVETTPTPIAETAAKSTFKVIADDNFDIKLPAELKPFAKAGLNNEQLSAFARAMAMWNYLNVNNTLYGNDSFNERFDGQEGAPMLSVNDMPYFSTGYSYDSFIQYARGVFTDEVADGLPKSLSLYGDGLVMRGENGELLENGGARGSNLYLRDYTVELTGKTEKEITFDVAAVFANYDAEAPFAKNAPTHQERFTQKMVLENNGGTEVWRVAEFNGWW